jgi:hypothetical protein
MLKLKSRAASWRSPPSWRLPLCRTGLSSALRRLTPARAQPGLRQLRSRWTAAKLDLILVVLLLEPGRVIAFPPMTWPPPRCAVGVLYFRLVLFDSRLMAGSRVRIDRHQDR